MFEFLYFCVYFYNVLLLGEYFVKFLMGSFRMDSFDDVLWVIIVVVNVDEGLINFVFEMNGSGFVVEIWFFLLELEIWTKKNEGMLFT